MTRSKRRIDTDRQSHQRGVGTERTAELKERFQAGQLDLARALAWMAGTVAGRDPEPIHRSSNRPDRIRRRGRR